MSLSAYIALGSNLGDPRANVLDAMDTLESWSISPLLRSSLWQTTPVACPPSSPYFVNAAIGLSLTSEETPENLLDRLLMLEAHFGPRERSVLNSPRRLDLDLIAFGDAIRNTETLTLPHPRAHLRRFVLSPLNEIAPDLILPFQERSVRDLLHDLGPDEEVTRLGPAHDKKTDADV